MLGEETDSEEGNESQTSEDLGQDNPFKVKEFELNCNVDGLRHFGQKNSQLYLWVRLLVGNQHERQEQLVEVVGDQEAIQKQVEGFLLLMRVELESVVRLTPEGVLYPTHYEVSEGERDQGVFQEENTAVVGNDVLM